MRNLLLILTAAFGLTMSAHAQLGWTLDDCIQKWGQPQKKSTIEGNRTMYQFESKGEGNNQFLILVDFLPGSTVVTRAVWGLEVKGDKWTDNDIKHWLAQEAPDATWGEGVVNPADQGATEYAGTVDDEQKYWGAIDVNRITLGIWTLEDGEAAKGNSN